MSRRVALALVAAGLFVVPAVANEHGGPRGHGAMHRHGAGKQAGQHHAQPGHMRLAQADAGTAAPAPPAPAPEKLDPKKLKAPKETAELLEKGKAAYAMSCVVCHGEKGNGDGPAGLALNPKPRDFAKDPFKQGAKVEEIFVSVTEGVKDTMMVGWPQLSEEDRWGISYYVLSMTPKNANGKAKSGKAKK